MTARPYTIPELAERWLTTDEAAEHCRLSVRHFRNLTKVGKLPKPKFMGRKLLWSLRELDEAISGRKDAPTDPIMAAINAAKAKSAALRP